MFVQLWGWGDRKQNFKAVAPLLPLPGPPSTPQAAFQSLEGGGPAPGEIRVTGGSGYSLAAREEPGPSQPDTEHSGKLVSRLTPSPPWDPLPALEPRGGRTGRRRQNQGGPSSSRVRWARRGLGGFCGGGRGARTLLPWL